MNLTKPNIKTRPALWIGDVSPYWFGDFCGPTRIEDPEFNPDFRCSRFMDPGRVRELATRILRRHNEREGDVFVAPNVGRIGDLKVQAGDSIYIGIDPARPGSDQTVISFPCGVCHLPTPGDAYGTKIEVRKSGGVRVTCPLCVRTGRRPATDPFELFDTRLERAARHVATAWNDAGSERDDISLRLRLCLNDLRDCFFENK